MECEEYGTVSCETTLLLLVEERKGEPLPRKTLFEAGLFGDGNCSPPPRTQYHDLFVLAGEGVEVSLEVGTAEVEVSNGRVGVLRGTTPASVGEVYVGIASDMADVDESV